jgi:hypothetical protein
MHYRELESRAAVSLRKRTKPVHAAPQHRPPAAALLALQRSHGNRYTQQVIARARRSPDDAGLDGATEAGLDSAIAQARGGGRQLDSSTRTLMEGAFGVDLSAVRAHTGRGPRRSAATSARVRSPRDRTSSWVTVSTTRAARVDASCSPTN